MLNDGYFFLSSFDKLTLDTFFWAIYVWFISNFWFDPSKTLKDFSSSIEVIFVISGSPEEGIKDIESPNLKEWLSDTVKLYDPTGAPSEVVIPETVYFTGILKNQLFALISLLSIPKVFIFITSPFE